MAQYIQSNGGEKRNFNQENYPARLSFRIEGEIKSFPDKQKSKKFITTKLALQEMLKGPF